MLSGLILTLHSAPAVPLTVALGLSGVAKTRPGLSPGGHGQQRQHDFPITASVLRTDYREALDQKPDLFTSARVTAVRATRQFTLVTICLVVAAGSRVCDFRARLRARRREAKPEKKRKRGKEQCSETIHDRIVPEGKGAGNVSKDLGLKFCENSSGRLRIVAKRRRSWKTEAMLRSVKLRR